MGNFGNVPEGAPDDYWWRWTPYVQRQWLRRGVLRAWREVLGWTQEQMVVKLQKYLPPDTLDLKTYRRWERGKTLPHPRNYLALQQMLLDLENYWTVPFGVFERGDFQAVLWMFIDSKSDLDVQWVLVNLKTYQIAKGMRLEPPMVNNGWDDACKEAAKIAQLWEPGLFESDKRQ